MAGSLLSKNETVVGEHLYELPFDQFQRYKGIEEVVTILRGNRRQRILDVGGYPGLISDFLPRDETYVVDMIAIDRTNCVRGDGTALPFKDNSFDVVTAIDTLEHVPLEKRSIFISELLRCSSGCVILMGPFFSEDIQMAEKMIFEFSLKTLGQDFANSHPLREHLEHGLPHMKQFISEIKRQGCAFEVFPSGYLYHWLILNFVKHFLFTIPDSDDLHKMVDKYYNSYFYEDDKKEPSYRHMFVITKDKRAAWLKDLKKNLVINGQADVKDLSYKIQLFGLLFSLFDLGAKRELHEAKKRNLQLEESLRNRELQFEDLQGDLKVFSRDKALLEEEVEKLKTRIANLQQTIAGSETGRDEGQLPAGKETLVQRFLNLLKNSNVR